MLALPKQIIINPEQTITFQYSLDQTFNYYAEPNNYKEAQTTIYTNLTYIKDDELWNTESFYRAKFRAGTCQDIERFDARFKYKFSNTTRVINPVISAHDDWDIRLKHPGFFCGLNPTDNEEFLIDEMMLLQGKFGIMEKIFTRQGDTNMSLAGNYYNTFKFHLKTSIYYEEYV